MEDTVQYICGSAPISAAAVFLEKPTNYKKDVQQILSLIWQYKLGLSCWTIFTNCEAHVHELSSYYIDSHSTPHNLHVVTCKYIILKGKRNRKCHISLLTFSHWCLAS